MFEMPKLQKWKIDSNGWGSREEEERAMAILGVMEPLLCVEGGNNEQ